MGRDLSFAPCGLVAERVETEAAGLLMVARPALPTAACPTCGSASARVHSTYKRFLADLPAHGQAVRISVRTRRFRCAMMTCGQRIFTERLAATAARPFARRTTRLEGYRASSRPGAGRTARAGLRATPASAGQQGHLAARWTERLRRGERGRGAAGRTGGILWTGGRAVAHRRMQPRETTMSPLRVRMIDAMTLAGLRARLARHMRRAKRPHWHVDLLTEAGRVAGAWIVPGGDECALVAALSHLPMPIPGFGASDCRRCRSHLLQQTARDGSQAVDLAIRGYACQLSRPAGDR